MTHPRSAASGGPTGALVVEESGAHYRIDGIEAMDPFLTTVVSDTDLWMFVSSTGALTAGRRNADHAAFPYQTDDRLHRAAGRVGPVTVLARTFGGRRELWRPFGPDLHTSGRRSLSKHVSGDRLVFEESHADWGLRWRAVWEPSDRYGWVRTSELINDTHGDLEVEVLDGFLDVMPDGVDAFFEQIRSNLVDAYKRSEVGPWGTVAVFNLETLITDQADPVEALSATTVWSWGFEDADIDLDERAVAAMLAGQAAPASTIVRGRPGSYLRRGMVTVEQDASVEWKLAVDVGLGHADVARLVDDVSAGRAADRLAGDVAAGASRLNALLHSADADQATGDPVADAHHRSNVLFNSMRGGAFVDGPNVPVDDLVDFIASRNATIASATLDLLRAEQPVRHVRDLLADALASEDPDLARLVLEYLPLTFSRRHGDPSRPWNRFDIDVRTLDGEQRLAYEGNWRDIFQNWEALLNSVPAFFPNVVAKFVNATSAEGYNPYRITRDGIEWEVPDPADPWAHIGYWGDHQLVYLLRLLQAWRRFDPAAIPSWLNRSLFSYADIPYRLADHDEMVVDPRNTIIYDEHHASTIARREAEVGADGRLLVDQSGSLVRVGLAEKLLVPALAKLACFVPGAGLWLNTQRPEWNDANNALAGSGASIVTLFHLRRYLDTLADIVESSPAVELQLSQPVARWCVETAAIFDAAPIAPDDPVAARSLLDVVGTAAAAHRQRVRGGARFDTMAVAAARVVAMCRRVIEHVDATLARARRDDGLFHSYNLVSFPNSDRVEVGHLTLMLEGQVAALSSGMLSPEESAGLVEAALDSGLHRRDLDTLLLYPSVELPAFLDRNVMSAEDVEQLRAAGIDTALLGDVVSPDPSGRLRFRSHVTNAGQLVDALDRTRFSEAQLAVVLEVFEGVFDHHSFTGRSARMYGYEGLGSVYWHMVAKLLLAVQEIATAAADDEATSDDTVSHLTTLYRRVRDGLGYRMSPERFGAFPTDCYSHNPAHSGAQQPGMTGQVKEEILTRFGELGLRIDDGRLRLAPLLLPLDDVLAGSTTFSYCGVSMTMTEGDTDRAVVRTGSESVTIESLTLPSELSARLFSRRGDVSAIDWTLGPDTIARWRSIVDGS